jgi:hypothetical protein
MTINAEQVIEKYIKLRDKKELIVREQKEALAPINEALEKIEAWLMRDLTSEGIQSKSSKFGTAFIQSNDSVTVEDKIGFLDFCKEKNAFELLDVRASKVVVRDYMEATGTMPVGIKYTQADVIRVRRK